MVDVMFVYMAFPPRRSHSTESDRNSYSQLFSAEISKIPVYWIYQRLFALVMQKEAEGGRLPLLPEGEVCDVLVQFRE